MDVGEIYEKMIEHERQIAYLNQKQNNRNPVMGICGFKSHRQGCQVPILCSSCANHSEMIFSKTMFGLTKRFAHGY
jgi:hypothetical protein